MQPVEFAVDAQVVVALFGEVDAGIEDDLSSREAGAAARRDLFLEEVVERGHDVVVADVGVRHLRLADAVHDEQGGAVLPRRVRALRVVGQSARDVVQDVAAEGEDGVDDFGAPGVDREEGRLILVTGWALSDLRFSAWPALDEGDEPRDFLVDGDGGRGWCGRFRRRCR